MILKSLLIFAAVAYISGEDCGTNEVYNACGTACPKTCKDPNPKFCTLQCVAGCFCKEGLVKNANGACVSPSACEEKTARVGKTIALKAGTCGAGEVYIENGPGCQRMCRNPSAGPCTNPPFSACYCKEGYARNDEGKCVKLEECPNTELGRGECVTGEVWNDCGLECQATCANKNPTCDKKCHRGCFCQKGAVRLTDSPLAPCVPVSNCTQS